jgi:hypothetical protein
MLKLQMYGTIFKTPILPRKAKKTVLDIARM